MDGKGSVLIWEVAQSKVDFVGCTDDSTFRSQPAFQPDPVGGVFAYRLEKDGQTATGQTCTCPAECLNPDQTCGCQISPSWCQDAVPAMTFQVAGDELLLSSQQSSPIQGSSCTLDESANWELGDQGTTMSWSVSHTLSLTGNATSCSQVDQQAKQSSTNGQGIQGCIFNFTDTLNYFSG